MHAAHALIAQGRSVPLVRHVRAYVKKSGVAELLAVLLRCSVCQVMECGRAGAASMHAVQHPMGVSLCNMVLCCSRETSMLLSSQRRPWLAGWHAAKAVPLYIIT